VVGEPNRVYVFSLLEKLSFLSRIFRSDPTRRTEADRSYDRKQDARTHDMVDGKGLDAQGSIIDFESDSERPRR
jgi:hypothetical protein